MMENTTAFSSPAPGHGIGAVVGLVNLISDSSASSVSGSGDARVPLRLDHCWSQPLGKGFNLRSRTYLVDRVKEPSEDPIFTLLGIDLWKVWPRLAFGQRVFVSDTCLSVVGACHLRRAACCVVLFDS